MANLPMNLDYAEAREFARGLVQRARTEPMTVLFDIEVRQLERADSEKFAREIFKRWATASTQNMMLAVEGAREGWTLAHEGLRDLILGYQDRREEMPTYLAGYAMDLVSGRLPKRRPAQRPESNFVRDLTITTMVLLTAERFHLKPTRNPTSHRHPSACAIIAEAMGMTERAVGAVWAKYSKHL